MAGDVDYGWIVTYSFLVVCYLVFILLSVLGVCRTFWSARKRVYQRLFFTFLVLGSATRLVRLVWGLLHQLELMEDDNDDNVYFYPLRTLPAYFFLTSYTILLSLFVEIFDTALRVTSGHGVPANFYRFVLVAMNAFIYLCAFSIYGVYFVEWETLRHRRDAGEASATEAVGLLFNASMYMIVVGITATYGLFLGKQLRRLQSNLSGRVMYMMGFISVCFFVRSIYTAVAAFIPVNRDWYWFGIYYLFLEVLPMMLILYVFAVNRTWGLQGISRICPCYWGPVDPSETDEVALLPPSRSRRRGPYQQRYS